MPFYFKLNKAVLNAKPIKPPMPIFIRAAPNKGKSKSKRGVFICLGCNQEFETRVDRVTSGYTVSCGCYLKKFNKITKLKHGHNGESPSLTYITWSGMLSRCNNKKVPSYKRYGGRGIKVCERWSSFSSFLKDMGEKPKGYTIERINNNGDYELNNCRWATKKEQQHNRRDNIIVYFNEVMMPLAKAYELSKSKVPYKTVQSRVNQYNWKLPNALGIV